jgi:multiple sugar transport system substrate-binding protein
MVGICLLLMMSGVQPLHARQTPLIVWNWALQNQDVMGDYFRRYNEEFQRLHPDIKLEVIASGSSMTPDALAVAVAGGAIPDLFFQNRFQIQELAHIGLYQPITQMAAAAGFKREQFVEGPWDESTYKSELYGIPHHTDARGLYYNVDLFNEAGLDPSRPPQTWSELLTAAKKLTRQNAAGELTQLGINFPANNGVAIFTLGFANGARFTNTDGTEAYFSEPALVEALEYILELQLVGGPRRVTDAFSSRAGTGVRGGSFASGKIGMLMEGNWNVGVYTSVAPQLNFDVAPIVNASLKVYHLRAV